MKKIKIEDVIKKGSFTVMGQNGWPNQWLFFLRYDQDKISFKGYSDKKPRITKKLKEKMAVIYLQDRAVDAHNRPLYYKAQELGKSAEFYFDNFSNVVGRNEDVFNTIKNALIEISDTVKGNEALQRLLDYECVAKEWREVRAKMKDRPSRVVVGKEPKNE